MSRAKYFMYLLLAFSISTKLIAAPVIWQSLAPGLDYTVLPISLSDNQIVDGKLHAFRIDLNQYQLKLATANSLNRNSASVKMLGDKNHAVVAINGGFFTPERQILGLRVSDGQAISPIKPISWWSIFYIKNNHAFIATSQSFKPDAAMSFAVQSGPRLVVNGSIPKLKPGIDERSALCITKEGKVIILATENSPIATSSLAKVLKQSNAKGGLNCQNALNLDGGSSTQVYAHTENFDLDIPNFNTVTDAVIVLPKSQ